MSYYFNKELSLAFDEAVARVISELKLQEFGILTEIDIKETLKKKINVNFRKYHIIGACNPNFAHWALQSEDKIGVMLPCNVIVQELDDGRVEVAAVDPVASMQAIDNPELADIAGQMRLRLQRVIENL
ncbi:DUF302 domain-containing protein [Geopsychrobacter electrodiphilus]|uniref:DUF302 domain-containing protein n=1 Tax=Geopsychrobacter electrodiphilus TaxID=225196 RepID=UPI0003703CF3|nr:DUF302 domain-containing protein [Geopsychrobacter electrodiphilus]